MLIGRSAPLSAAAAAPAAVVARKRRRDRAVFDNIVSIICHAGRAIKEGLPSECITSRGPSGGEIDAVTRLLLFV
jgi:hypothetical protein